MYFEAGSNGVPAGAVGYPLNEAREKVVGFHEEASVKTKSEKRTGFPRHPFGINRHDGAPQDFMRLPSIQLVGIAMRQAHYRGATLNPTLDLDVELVLYVLPMIPPSPFRLAVASALTPDWGRATRDERGGPFC